jgi:hypothetical protein
MAKGIHEDDDKYSWFEHKHHMIQQILSRVSKIVATSNFKILTLLDESKMACNQNIMFDLENLESSKAIKYV